MKKGLKSPFFPLSPCPFTPAGLCAESLFKARARKAKTRVALGLAAPDPGKQRCQAAAILLIYPFSNNSLCCLKKRLPYQSSSDFPSRFRYSSGYLNL